MSEELLGRVSVGDRVVSARLNPGIADTLMAATTDEQLTNATLDDALEASQSSQAGGMKRRREGETPEEKKAREEAEAAVAADEAAREERRAARRIAKAAEGSAGPAGAGAGDVVMSGVPAPAPESVLTGPEAKRTKTESSLTRKAIGDMIAALDETTGAAAGAVDTAAATLIGLLPTAVKSAAMGAGTTFMINNPTIFAQVVRVVTQAAQSAIEAGSGTTWGQYQLAVEQIATHLGGLAETVRGVGLDSPWFVITAALLIMRYRANGAGTTISRLLIDDATRLTGGARAIAEVAGEGAMGAGAGAAAGSALGKAAEVVWATVVNAYGAVRERSASALREARGQAQVEPLRELARRASTGGPTGEGAAAIRAATLGVGAPAAQAGPGGAITLVPSTEPRELRAAQDALTRIRAPKEEVRAAEALGAGAGAGAGSAMEVEEESLSVRPPRDTKSFSPPTPPGKKKGGKRPKRKTFRKKKGKKTRGKSRRAFIY